MMLKLSIRYGLIIGVVIGAVMLVPFYLLTTDERIARMDSAEIVGYGIMIAALCLIFVALWEQRRRHGTLSFAGGLGLALGVTGVAALVFGLATTLTYSLMGAAEIDAFMRAYIEHSGGSLDDYEQQRRLWLNPWFQGLIMAVTVALIGAIVSLIAALVMRRPARAGVAA